MYLTFSNVRGNNRKYLYHLHPPGNTQYAVMKQKPYASVGEADQQTDKSLM